MHFGDEKFVKELDFATFAQWESVRTLLEGFEGEGAIIDGLWDVREKMPIWSGDWEARVYPGLEVDARCRKPHELQVHSSSDDPEEGGPGEALRHSSEPCARHWWFGRWRMKVEQETMGIGGAVREPSRRMVLLGVVAMGVFLGIVFVFCLL
ncbi:hypothetical protein DE146DRAFT_620294 [Phaeosphaeria sp. MPI-PUGE-AT-0046c]|nr:hypothetical protein DE146DRAFT_620294 [Phaeosphaeria sp. MPI-PUGE-AT-0046c]